MGKWDKGRSAVYVMAGGYLLYLAYKLFTMLPNYEGTNATVMLVFAIFFLVIGAAILGLALYMSIKGSSRNEETNREDAAEDNADNKVDGGK